MPRWELHDRFFKQAKAEGYVARSAYKLKHIQNKRKALRGGDRVLDLGCAPGSWMQVAAEIVGPRGMVAGIDLQDVDARALGLPSNARAARLDAFRATPAELLGLAGVEVFDVVLSDMAPNTTGAGDHFRSVELCRRVLELAAGVLRPGGNLVMKVFEGEEYPALLRDTARRFEEAKGFKPEATRAPSKEMFIVARGFRPPARPPAPPTAPPVAPPPTRADAGKRDGPRGADA